DAGGVGEPSALMTDSTRCMKLLVKSRRPSLPPVPSNGGYLGPLVDSTYVASSHWSEWSGNVARQRSSSSALTSPPSFSVMPSSVKTDLATAMVSRYSAKRTARDAQRISIAVALSFG